ncbi:MAG: chromate resistance protein ChrB domain-containing protein [Candidatus Binatia bacterium]
MRICRARRSGAGAEEIDLTRESAGIRAISHGFSLVAKDDAETVEKASFLYDALYAALQAELSQR